MKSLFIFTLFFASVTLSQTTNLLDQNNQYDYIIITIENYIQTFDQFIKHKETYNGFSVRLTTKTEILKEFNAKQEVQENIRDFISYAGNNWKNPKPKYFLFGGDLDSIPNFVFRSVNFATYTDSSYSDYYYAVDTSSIDSLNVSYSVGRIPARTKVELDNYLNKVIVYEENTKYENWNGRALFVSDNDYVDNNYEGEFHAKTAFHVASQVPDYINSDFVIPIDTSQFFGSTDDIIDKLNSGVSSALFTGHANSIVFTHESLFVKSNVYELINTDKPFFVSIYGNQQFSRDTNTSLINELILSEYGALSSINPVGIHFSNSGKTLFGKIFGNLYKNNSVGDIYLEVMNSTTDYLEKRKINIYGDPAITLKTDPLVNIENIITQIPSSYSLDQNYPNPFNPTTKIRYSIPLVKGQRTVKLKVYDILGNELLTLVNEEKSAGVYEVEFNASDFSSGVYFYTLKAGNFVQTKKMILMK